MESNMEYFIFKHNIRFKKEAKQKKVGVIFHKWKVELLLI